MTVSEAIALAESRWLSRGGAIDIATIIEALNRRTAALSALLSQDGKSVYATLDLVDAAHASLSDDLPTTEPEVIGNLGEQG